MQALFLKDARYFQLVFQSVFLLYGILFLHWDAEWWLYATYFGTSTLTQVCCECIFISKASRSTLRMLRGLPSAFISAFGLSLLLKTTHIEVAVLAAFVAIFSKYTIRVNGKHIFNPSAFGIITAIVCTNDAWISAAQWGSGIVILFGTLSLGCIVVTRVQKLDTSIAFLGTFAALLFVRQILLLGWPTDYFVQSVTTGSLLLFSFFMITDPKTTPGHSGIRMIWAASNAAMAFYLATFQFVTGAPVWALILLQPLIPILDYLFAGKQFEWRKPVQLLPANAGKVLPMAN
jgi:Na+-transporting NADH:ubiquinone oxidoreductase subunit NqrB